jgi:methionine-gamma-lyase
MDLHTGSLMLLGPTMDPQVAFDISLRLPHLGLRMAEHSRRALEIARRLQEAGLPVVYPGLGSHPDHALLETLANPDFGAGGVLSLDLGSRDRAFEFMGRLQNDHRFGLMAVSLGYSETLMSCSAASTSSEMPDEELVRAGIAPGLVRLSIGYTGTLEQRWSQLQSVLQAMGMMA